ncbi:Major facilitator superfamily domain-containing protein 8 [Gracilariopsis chorda]|uniref:Major facilitator superfamily domain-containing protein 8 n=1 Tax=Gracilariopsis chorda TaxID=448386 RepID=A0A2V3IHS3_9FLOR|nr:Major facilitator superfamily domain-containing protein 8 [Gracilariopsis chorda]|eukprot:PXF41573.1 Major facilitator superfamily domain-containing protein 8 [Gracilariopsis chorda]
MGLHAPPPGHIDWVSLLVIYWVILVSEASRGLMLPSTWPFLASLGGSKHLLGVFVASFSMGRMATTIPLGYFSDKYSTSTVLGVASIIQIIGHFLYAVSASVPMLFVSRIIVGFGSATMSVCRAHVTRTIPLLLRTHHFAYLSALQFIGFAVLPGLGGLLAKLPHFKPLPFIPFNSFTYPAYVLIFCNFVAIMFVQMFYFNPPDALHMRAQRDPEQPDPSVQPFSLTPDALALLVCLLVNIVFRGVVAEFETISTPFLMEQFGLTFAQASFRISLMGFFGLLVYLSFKPIAKQFSDRLLLFVGIVLVIVGCFPLSILPLTTHMSLNMYVMCLGMSLSLAYPLGQTAVLSLFSKVLAGLPAGGLLGIFSATGSMARILFAILAGTIWSEFGRESVFAVILAYMSMASTVVLLSFKRLVPPRHA